jgi:hypothetical protein
MHKRTWKKNANHEVDITYKEMGRYNEWDGKIVNDVDGR